MISYKIKYDVKRRGGTMKKSIFVKCVSIVTAVCLCFGFLGNESLAYATDEAGNASEECVEFYDEIGPDDGISPCSYFCERNRYLRIIRPDDETVVAEITVKIIYEYADNSWVVVHDTQMSIHCYQGFLVSANDNKDFGGGGSDYDYCKRTFMLKGPNGNIVSAILYAGADCYGDTYLNCYWDKIYILGYTVYEV